MIKSYQDFSFHLEPKSQYGLPYDVVFLDFAFSEQDAAGFVDETYIRDQLEAIDQLDSVVLVHKDLIQWYLGESSHHLGNLLSVTRILFIDRNDAIAHKLRYGGFTTAPTSLYILKIG